MSGMLFIVSAPSGAGKTTLVRALAGDLRPSRGRVALDGRDLRAVPALEQARRRAVLPQGGGPRFDLTALEVALLGRYPHALAADGPRDLEIARAALERVGAGGLEGRAYPSLSGGEASRVRLARALAQVWDVPRPALLLDEPTADLDTAHAFEALGVARGLAAAGAAVLAVTHDLNLAARVADRLAVLRGGALEALGSPREVLTPALLERAFGLRAAVADHPEADAPLVVPLGRAG